MSTVDIFRQILIDELSIEDHKDPWQCGSSWFERQKTLFDTSVGLFFNIAKSQTNRFDTF